MTAVRPCGGPGVAAPGPEQRPTPGPRPLSQPGHPGTEISIARAIGSGPEAAVEFCLDFGEISQVPPRLPRKDSMDRATVQTGGPSKSGDGLLLQGGSHLADQTHVGLDLNRRIVHDIGPFATGASPVPRRLPSMGTTSPGHSTTVSEVCNTMSLYSDENRASVGIFQQSGSAGDMKEQQSWI